MVRAVVRLPAFPACFKSTVITSAATLSSSVRQPLAHNEVHLEKSPGHHRIWIDCIRSPTHLGRMSRSESSLGRHYHLGLAGILGSVPIAPGPVKLEFGGYSAANTGLDRERRDPGASSSLLNPDRRTEFRKRSVWGEKGACSSVGGVCLRPTPHILTMQMLSRCYYCAPKPDARLEPEQALGELPAPDDQVVNMLRRDGGRRPRSLCLPGREQAAGVAAPR